jgi:hypothetical protein
MEGSDIPLQISWFADDESSDEIVVFEDSVRLR